MEKAQINLNEIIEKVKIRFDDSDKLKIFPSNQSFWKPSEILTMGSFRSCHTFLIPDSYKRNVAIENFNFFMKGNVSWMVHSPGFVNRKEIYSYNILEHSAQKYKINFEVYHMLEYTNQICDDEPDYDKDKCIDDYVIQESMNKINCTWPFVKNKNHICTEDDSAKKAWKIGRKGLKNSKCSSPCNYLKAMSIPVRKDKLEKIQIIQFLFPESIRVQRAYYAYSGVSLIAEIGGYVGLFLGWSVYQITDVVEYSIQSLKTKINNL